MENISTTLLIFIFLVGICMYSISIVNHMYKDHKDYFKKHGKLNKLELLLDVLSFLILTSIILFCGYTVVSNIIEIVC